LLSTVSRAQRPNCGDEHGIAEQASSPPTERACPSPRAKPRQALPLQARASPFQPRSVSAEERRTTVCASGEVLSAEEDRYGSCGRARDAVSSRDEGGPHRRRPPARALRTRARGRVRGEAGGSAPCARGARRCAEPTGGAVERSFQRQVCTNDEAADEQMESQHQLEWMR